jgi:hypothetical protein
MVESTGFVVTAHDMNSLLSLINSHLAINKISYDIPEGLTLREMVEDQMCRNLPQSFCCDPTQKRYVQIQVTTRPPTIQIASQLGKNHLERTIALICMAKTNPNPFVEQIVAEQRALLAQKCPYVRTAKVCYSCHHEGPVRQCMGGRRSTSLDSRLYVCGKLGVYMQAAVHINRDVIRNLFTPEDLLDISPDFWFFPEL